MPFTITAENAAATAVGAAGSYLSFHTADPGSTGASEVTGGSYTREQTTWAAASAGSITGSQTTTDIPAGTTITHWGLWSAVSGGSFLYGGVLGAAEAFGAAGTYAFTPTITATG